MNAEVSSLRNNGTQIPWKTWGPQLHCDSSKPVVVQLRQNPPRWDEYQRVKRTNPGIRYRTPRRYHGHNITIKWD